MTTADEQWQLTGDRAELYERYAVARHLRPIAEEFLHRVPVHEHDRGLDAACGTGIVARLVAPRLRAPGNVVGLDLNEGMLAVARRLAPDIEWRQGDLMALPFDDAQFTLALCQQGLQFVTDRLRALQEMRRVLAPGGRLALNLFGAPSRFHVALADGLARFADATAARSSLAPFAFPDSRPWWPSSPTPVSAMYNSALLTFAPRRAHPDLAARVQRRAALRRVRGGDEFGGTRRDAARHRCRAEGPVGCRQLRRAL